jgi:nicotinamidase-related amidase
MPPSAPSSSVDGLLLLCVDLQPVFLRIVTAPEILQRRCAFALQAATGLGIPIVFTEQAPAKLGATATELLALARSPDVFAKTTFSATTDAAIRERLIAGHAEHVLLCGVETSVCIYQTALGLLALGTQVTLLSDCVGGRRDPDSAVCLDALRRAGVHVLPSETVFYSLLHDVSHPFFREFSQLVKQHA